MFEGTRALLPSAFAQYSCSEAIHLGQLSTNCFPIILESTQKARVSISSCFRALLWLVRKTKVVIESSFEELKMGTVKTSKNILLSLGVMNVSAPTVILKLKIIV